MKEILEITLPIEYKIEQIQEIPDKSDTYLLILSAAKQGVKKVEVQRSEITPLMNCVSSRTPENLVEKHFIENEINSPLGEKIRIAQFVPKEESLG